MRHQWQGNIFLHQIAPGDKSWCYHELVSKRQSMQWKHEQFPSARKVMVSIYFFYYYSLLVLGVNINDEWYANVSLQMVSLSWIVELDPV